MHELHTPEQAAQWLRAQVKGTLQTDSRQVGPGDGFIAWPGAATDGRQHVPAALAQGAAACLVERSGVDAHGFEGELIATYAQLKAATGPIAAAYYGEPTQQLAVLAVTGTNGKTSTAWWLAQALSNLGPHAGDPGRGAAPQGGLRALGRPGGAQVKHSAPIRCGLVGTLGIGQPPEVEFTGLTTPDPVLLQRHFRRFVDQGFAACAIEASSIGLAERRLDGTRIRVAIFTNFTQDHLDYHGSMDAYWQAKVELFRWPGLQAAVVNLDDPKGAELATLLAGTSVDTWTVSCSAPARLQARDIGYGAQGLQFAVLEGDERHELATQLIGQYNVANLLGVIAAMRSLGVPLAEAAQACRHLLPVPGRMEVVSVDWPSQGEKVPLGATSSDPDQPLVAIDYAHTPDALDKALNALRPLAEQRGGQLWCVFGCGGDRDPLKRPLMAAVAEKNADEVVVTSDNPRSEKPEAIISQVLLGLSHDRSVQVQADRALAIAETLEQAAAEDVVLIAGKGHEDYQEVAGVKQPFSDQAHARAALRRRGDFLAMGRAGA